MTFSLYPANSNDHQRKEPKAQRYDTIDLLRGISILGVVLLHAKLWLSFSDFDLGSTLPRWLRDLLFSSGGSGVSAFFAVSGFLITYVSSLRFGGLRRLQATTFYRIRFARIFPMLALLVIVLSLLHAFGPSFLHIPSERGSLWQAIFAVLTFQVNRYEAVHGFLPAPWTVLWSLSIEEMFYLFFPALCILLLKPRFFRPLFFLVLGGLILFGPFARTPWYSKNDVWLYQSYLGNVDNIAMGCIAALASARLQSSQKFVASRGPEVLNAVGILLTLFIFIWDWPKVIFGWHVRRALGRSGTDTTLLGLGVCLIMIHSVVRNTPGWRWTGPLRWFGRYSYEIYLTHEFMVMAVLSLFLRMKQAPVALWVVATVLLSGGLGYALSRLVSEPMNRTLRDKYTPPSAALR